MWGQYLTVMWGGGGGHLYIITINVPVVFMARYVMVLRGATSLRGALGPNGTRFARAISGPKKVSIFRAHPFQCPSE